MADPSPTTQPRPEEDGAQPAYPMEGLLLDEESAYRAMDTAGTGDFSPLSYKTARSTGPRPESRWPAPKSWAASGTTWTVCC